ncbi:hypothetical protein PPERSA_03954 [Pseudocohnilembus persalinus]|uniref:Uncharacterized protein n=1 Tax=Pseudocohnilembus persalinus TaxID=266149 RepID=A0A0V0QAM8_PSEPJ|nr:hypothetical protein PPERSA_03954 [Pseudocohnilembus persalinus]|eukprot:KRW99248.1 hypothetical protein PPERSA_03954 [Pseudocohnilembus persalinus]
MFYLLKALDYTYLENKQNLPALAPENIFYGDQQICVPPIGIFPFKQYKQGNNISLAEQKEFIGFTILQMALLIPSHQFNVQMIDQYLHDFGRIYSGTSNERLLHFVVTGLLLGQEGVQQVDVYKFLEPYEQDLIFLNLYRAKKQINASLQIQYQTQYLILFLLNN